MRTLQHNWLMKVKCSRIKSFDDCKEISVANRFLLAHKWQVFNTLRNMGSEIKIHLSVGAAVIFYSTCFSLYTHVRLIFAFVQHA